MTRKKIGFCALLVLVALIVAYAGSYLVLSVKGCYEPALIGLGGVKQYSWAPSGFVVGYEWKRWPAIIYLPLCVLDERLWHTPDKSNSGQYPVDEVRREDIWKLYQAYGFFDKKEPSAVHVSKAEHDKP
jgi:hypothetical protein